MTLLPFGPFKYGKRVCLGIEDVLVERKDRLVREEEEEVFECFGEKVTGVGDAYW